MNQIVTCEMSQPKPSYFFNKEINACEIVYGSKKFTIDIEDAFKIINCDKRFNFYSNCDVYPSYKINYRQVTYLEFIYELNIEKNTYSFLNKDCYDLRRSNVITDTKEVIISYFDVSVIDNVKTDIDTFENTIMEKYKSVKKINNGHYTTMGREANKIKNPIWKFLRDDGEERLLMYCGKNTICILCPEGYQNILNYEKQHNDGCKITFTKNTGGYISGSVNLYIHQIIMKCHGNGKGTKNISVDHIDRDPLNNTLENLRIATRGEQEQNSKGIADGTKRARKHNAKALPAGITQDMMRKYVVYYHEYVDKEKTKTREFFKVETHPKLEKIWVGTKSNKVSIMEKLQMVNKVVDDLEENIYPE
jgi:hypothetical protein